jgi:hypothetical protein
MFAFFPYTGNSTGTSMVYDVTRWFTPLVFRLKTAPEFVDRIDGDIIVQSFADTPITMTRNRAVKAAQQSGADILVMVDSDMAPDCHLGPAAAAGQVDDAQPFFDVAFNAIYEHHAKGPLVIAAPYGGCPPHENIFAFRWRNKMNDPTKFSLEQYTREEAAVLGGLHDAAAAATGLIAYDMRVFDYIKPPYFRYEWTDDTESDKCSTEDVQNTRNLSQAVIAQLGYNPLKIAWSSWAGHLKVWCVGKPHMTSADQVCDQLKDAIRRPDSDERLIEFPADNAERLGIAGLPVHRPATPVVKPNDNGDKPTCEMYPEHRAALLKFLDGEAERLDRPIKVAEIGVWIGETSLEIANSAAVEHLICVDHFMGNPGDWTSILVTESGGRENIRQQFIDRMVGGAPQSKWALHEGSSLDIGPLMSRVSPTFDVVFIDADHEFSAVQSDIKAWWPALREGGVMIGHDYHVVRLRSVTEAVEDWFGKDFMVYAEDQHGAFWVARKQEKHACVSRT